jgi:hypothetical protein
VTLGHKLTNNLGLPDGVVAAVTNDPYSRGNSDISVTQLISPPYQRRLRQEVEASTEVDIIEDVSDRIWSLLGQSVHTVLERAYRGKGLVEQRLFHEVNGWTVSGQFDVIEDGCLQDFKVTSVWQVMDRGKREWEEQLNLLRLLAHHNGIAVSSLRIIAILRDWSKGKASAPGYPSAQVATIDAPMWSLEQAEEFLLARVKAHQDPDPPICSDEERWMKPDKYAVMRDGRKSAVRLFEDETEAKLHAIGLGEKTHTVVARPGGYTRCEQYCNVSHQCRAMKTAVGF